jgi:hypothetical protein
MRKAAAFDGVGVETLASDAHQVSDDFLSPIRVSTQIIHDFVTQAEEIDRLRHSHTVAYVRECAQMERRLASRLFVCEHGHIEWIEGRVSMLVLNRTVKQAVIIGDGEIEIQILSIEKGRVRLGIRAPKR